MIWHFRISVFHHFTVDRYWVQTMELISVVFVASVFLSTQEVEGDDTISRCTANELSQFSVEYETCHQRALQKIKVDNQIIKWVEHLFILYFSYLIHTYTQCSDRPWEVRTHDLLITGRSGVFSGLNNDLFWSLFFQKRIPSLKFNVNKMCFLPLFWAPKWITISFKLFHKSH